jgi:hypothetical protein
MIPFGSKALSAEHRPKFCSPSPAMVTSPYKWNILKRDINSINQEAVWLMRPYFRLWNDCLSVWMSVRKKNIKTLNPLVRWVCKGNVKPWLYYIFE